MIRISQIDNSVDSIAFFCLSVNILFSFSYFLLITVGPTFVAGFAHKAPMAARRYIAKYARYIAIITRRSRQRHRICSASCTENVPPVEQTGMFIRQSIPKLQKAASLRHS